MIFITGFPGFLATEFMKRRLEWNSDTQFLCLVQEKYLSQSQDALRAWQNERIKLVTGDITQTDLGLDRSTLPPIDEIFHFAAVYDLNVSQELANKINVSGTLNLLQMARSLRGLRKLHYVSTCYVSGRFQGNYSETDLNSPGTFNNFYESSKYQAEFEVRKFRTEMQEKIEVTIYRPAIVVGDSQTGATQKYDGPYYILQWLLRQPRLALLPRLFSPDRYSISIVPSDYVTRAIEYLSRSQVSSGKTYHLSNPRPDTVARVIQILAEESKRVAIPIPLPLSLAKAALRFFPRLERFLGIPRNALNYFAHPSTYPCSQTQEDLKGSGISCPSFAAYAPKLVQFMRENPSLRTSSLH